MSRFEEFDRHEKRVIREALEWAQSEFYDPGHTQDDRDTLHALIEEAQAATERDDDRQRGIQQPKVRPGVYMRNAKIGLEIPLSQEVLLPARDQHGISNLEETIGGFDRGGHPIIRRPDGSTERITHETPTRQAQDGRQRQPGEYTGFLYIECAHCGHIHAFCAKQPIRTYRCEECGGKTPLIDMYPLRVACECGARFNYMTNIVTQRMDVACYRCGAPVAVEWVDKLQKYQPMTYPQARGKRKKGGRK